MNSSRITFFLRNYWYTVESDERGAPGGYGTEDSFKLFDCRAEDLEII